MNKRLLKYLLFSSIFLLLTMLAPAQQFPCGTTVTQEQKDFELALADSVYQVVELNRTFHIAVFITEDNKGQPNMNPSDINNVISELNAVFDRIKTSFSVYAVNYIDNYHYDEIHIGTNEHDMMAQNIVRNVINLYLVSGLYNNAGEGICAYTYYPADSTDVILLSKSCLNGTFLIEQIGHFFNLYHTHETTFGDELVDRTACKTTGDRCCDTPADPGLTQKVSVDCQYTGTQKDAMGNYYFLTTANFMSFSPLGCRCYFSDKQYRRMINCMRQVKQYLW
jgi:hypothetical protein